MAKEIDVRKKREGLMYHSRGWIWVCLTMLLTLSQTLVMKITPIGVVGGGWGVGVVFMLKEFSLEQCFIS